MDDNGFDACEYIWNNKIAMQRLLFILRQRQDYCTDNECYSLSRLPGPRDITPSEFETDFFLTCLLLGFLVLMYILRPNSLRRLANNNDKDQNNESGPSGGAPPAPPAPPATN